MYTCPACGYDKVAGKATCQCGADLSLLQCLDAAVDAWFNEALEALSRNEVGKALEWLAACCTARPSDAVARRSLAKVWAQLGHVQEARRSLEVSVENDPDHPDVAAIRAALADMENAPIPEPSQISAALAVPSTGVLGKQVPDQSQPPPHADQPLVRAKPRVKLTPTVSKAVRKDGRRRKNQRGEK